MSETIRESPRDPERIKETKKDSKRFRERETKNSEMFCMQFQSKYLE